VSSGPTALAGRARQFQAPPRELVDEIRRLSERRLTADELRAYIEAPMSDDEQSEIRDLVRWFRDRYPRPLDRLVSSRKAYARAMRRSPP